MLKTPTSKPDILLEADLCNIYPAKKLLISPNLQVNNFDILRCLLAIAVVYSHFFVIYYGTQEETKPIKIFTRNQVDLGSVAVNCFFVISGFLILRSFEFSSSISSYLTKRILRICPGFFAAYLLSVLVLAPLSTLDATFSFWKIKLFFANFEEFKFFGRLLTLQAPIVRMGFESLPLPHMINESLWTIQYEFICYLILPAIGIVTGIYKRKWLMLALFATAYIILGMQELAQMFQWENYNGRIMGHPLYLPRFFVYFFAGCCFYLYRGTIIRSKAFVVLSTLGIIASSVWGVGFNMVFPIAGTYLLFYVAYHPKIKFSQFAKNGDLSYGLYLYAWPVQQFVMYLLGEYLAVHYLFFLTVPIVWGGAYLSWHFVEKPFLKLKHIKFVSKGAVLAKLNLK